MNRKGFTLIELLATIVLLTLITLLASFTVNKISNDSKNNSHKTQVNNILGAAITYVNDNDSIKISDLDGLKIYLKDLSSGGYIDSEIKDPLNNKYLNFNTSYVLVTKKDSLDTDDLSDYRYSGNYLYVLNIVYR